MAVPVAWCAVTALLVFGLALTAGGEPASALKLALIAGAICWLLLMLSWRDLWCSVETVTGVDLDRDGTVGQPVPLVRLDLDGRATLLDLGIAPHQLARIARVAWQGHLSDRSCGLPRQRWHDVRDQLIALGILAWRDAQHERAGVELTPRGERALRYLWSPADSAGADRPDYA